MGEGALSMCEGVGRSVVGRAAAGAGASWSRLDQVGVTSGLERWLELGSTGGSSHTVVLGPPVELHSGVHESLRLHPPPGVTYVGVRGRHHFWHESLEPCPWILYMGRDSVAKESGIAVRVFSRLDARLGRQARLVWVGPEPSARLPDRGHRRARS